MQKKRNPNGAALDAVKPKTCQGDRKGTQKQGDRKGTPLQLLPVVYGLCVFLFFWKYFPYHLHFHEQFQMFLFTKSYFIEVFSRPGGFSNYAGQFITQFYISSFVGAILISCMLTGIQQLVYAIIRRFRGGEQAGSPLRYLTLFLSFLPSLFYWYLLCDEDSQTGGVVALLITLIAALTGTFPKSGSARRACLFACIPILYWFAGGSVILCALLLIFYEWRLGRDGARPVFGMSVLDGARPVSTALAAICLVTSLPFIAKFFLKQYTLSRYWWGVDYVHFVNYSPVLITLLWALIFLIVAGVVFLPKTSNGFRKFSPLLQYFSYSIILLFVIYTVILKIACPKNLWKEELMGYDYHCRMQNWDKVTEMARKKSPTVPITVSCLNLALYKTGQLPEKMFEFYQNGPEGLLPTFQRDFMIPIVAGEPYYYLGFVNTAQRFAFEAMEAFPDYQKSVRSIKRLAETNLISGYYEAASKYLYLLENTLFYRKWAKETRAFLYDEARIDAHPEWGTIRRFQPENDFLFSGREKDMMLGIVFQHNNDNRMAYEYLLAYALLTKDIRTFPLYFQITKNFTYPEIPKSWQEALVYIWGLTNNDMDAIPFPVSRIIKQNVINYANIYTSMESPEPVLRKQFPKTYWYYFHFHDYNQVNSESPLQY